MSGAFVYIISQHSCGHMVATTIMRWQLSEALLSRSGATRERCVCENWQGGKMCSTNPV